MCPSFVHNVMVTLYAFLNLIYESILQNRSKTYMSILTVFSMAAWQQKIIILCEFREKRNDSGESVHEFQ